MTKLLIEDIGAINRLNIEAPEGGGIVVLKGSHGVGKSTALRAVDALATNRGANKLQVRDGAARGEVSGFGARITVGRRTNRSGELEVTSLDGKLAIGDLIDPGMVSDDANDAKRIKALVQLAGVEADPKLFYGLLGGDSEAFDAILAPDQQQTDDILVLADRVKRAIEAAARLAEGKANTERAHAAACAEAANGVDMNQSDDPAILQACLESAIRSEQQLQAERKAASEQAARIEKAKVELARAESSAAGQDLAAAEQSRLSAAEADNEAKEAVKECERKLKEASNQLELARMDAKAKAASLKSANESLAVAKQNAEIVAMWRKTLNESGEATAPPLQSIMDDATLAVMTARKAVENGALVREAKKRLAKREDHVALAKIAEQRAQQLRDAAGSVDAVLSEQIAKLGCTLRVEKGRLVTDTDRGVELFSELSDGERTLIAVDIAIDAVGEKGLIVLPQTVFESLNDPSRTQLAEHARKRGAVIITAEVTNPSDGPELVAETFAGAV